MLGLVAAALAVPRRSFGQAPAIMTAESARPQLPCGVQAGDVAPGRAVIWARCDRPARMIVEHATTESFADARRVIGPHALEPDDLTARIDLRDLPPDQTVFYRVLFQDLGDLATLSAPVAGRFRTAPASRRDVTLLWSADTVGQGWGINPDMGGMTIYETMRRAGPDLFVHCGDTIYADGPLAAEVRLPDGSLWRNLVTEAKSKVAETLDEFRGNYRYNFLDANLRRFNSEVPQVWQWDDHEVVDNWSDSKDLTADARYAEKRVRLLTARAKRAFLDYAPLRPARSERERIYRRIPYGPLLDLFVIDMRGHRGPNSHNRQAAAGSETALLGSEQMRWLLRGLGESRAVWKVIAADQPLGLMIGDGRDGQGRDRFEGVANGPGPALGRELEIAELLRAIKARGVRNTLWITGDCHYAAAHRFDPGRARFTEFDPFWEFMAGPLNAGTFGPNRPDDTFGLEVVFQKVPPAGRLNLPPSAGLQFFGALRIDGGTGALTASLNDAAGTTLFRTELAPAPG